MEVKKNITELKDKLADSLQLWIDERIDGLVLNNPQLKVASVYLKRGAKNSTLTNTTDAGTTKSEHGTS